MVFIHPTFAKPREQTMEIRLKKVIWIYGLEKYITRKKSLSNKSRKHRIYVYLNYFIRM